MVTRLKNNIGTGKDKTGSIENNAECNWGQWISMKLVIQSNFRGDFFCWNEEVLQLSKVVQQSPAFYLKLAFYINNIMSSSLFDIYVYNK